MDFDLTVLQKRLSDRGFQAFVCADNQETINLISKELLSESDSVVGIGNSITLKELELTNILSSKTVYERNIQGKGEDERKALLADIYFTSANAISYDGQIINIDGTGNRVAATCFGPKHVVFVIGKNKIADSFENAIERARNAAVALAKIYERKTPCVVTGKCENCISPESICGVTTIHRKQLYGNKISIILVDKNLGL
ncbi:MAG: lactate utilization protein [Defluviitaleaceae bacterium]|nr:lactate utilization protein [Defluviitaleaceae bacterium]